MFDYPLGRDPLENELVGEIVKLVAQSVKTIPSVLEKTIVAQILQHMNASQK